MRDITATFQPVLALPFIGHVMLQASQQERPEVSPVSIHQTESILLEEMGEEALH